MNDRTVLVRLVDGTTIEGKVNIEKNRRVSDFLSRGTSPFIVLFDASVDGREGQICIINKSQILLVLPREETAGDDEG